MKYRELGNTGLEVSEIGFGVWAIGGNKHGNSYGPTNDKDSFKAIKKARELMGPTDSKIAPPGTIRGDFGVDTTINVVHGSDSPESVAYAEISPT